MRLSVFLVLVFAAAIAGCRASIPADRFACSLDQECPPGQSCGGDGFCHGQGMASDAGSPDGGGPDGGPLSVTVRFVNAIPGSGPVMFSVGAVAASLSYGETSAPLSVEVRGGAFDVTTSVGVSSPVSATGSAFAVLVDEPGVGRRFIAVPDDLAGTGEHRILPLLTGVQDGLAVIEDPTAPTPSPVTFAEVVGPRASPAAGTAELVAIDDPTAPDAIASFGQVAAGGTLPEGLIVLAGNAGRPLGAPDGPRAFVAKQGSPLFPSDPLYGILNATSDGSTVPTCTGAGSVPTDAAPGFSGFEPGFPGVGVLYVSTSTTACTAGGGPMVDLGTQLPAQRRSLVVITGTGASPTLDIVPEPAFAAEASMRGASSWANLAPAFTGGPVDFLDPMAATSFAPDVALRNSKAGWFDLMANIEVRWGSTATLGTFAPTLPGVGDQLFVALVDRAPGAAGPAANAHLVLAPWGGHALATVMPLSCPPGLTPTTNRCVDTQRDPLNCGSLFSSCRGEEQCVGGTCVCRAGLLSLAAGGCVDPYADPSFCGIAGFNSCMGGVPACLGGACVALCTAGTWGCAGSVTGSLGCIDDLNTNPLHCGACNQPCVTGEVCLLGNCVSAPPVAGCTACPCPCPAGTECNDSLGSTVCVTVAPGVTAACGLFGAPCTTSSQCCSGTCRVGGKCR